MRSLRSRMVRTAAAVAALLDLSRINLLGTRSSKSPSSYSMLNLSSSQFHKSRRNTSDRKVIPCKACVAKKPQPNVGLHHVQAVPVNMRDLAVKEFAFSLVVCLHECPHRKFSPLSNSQLGHGEFLVAVIVLQVISTHDGNEKSQAVGRETNI